MLNEPHEREPSAKEEQTAQFDQAAVNMPEAERRDTPPSEVPTENAGEGGTVAQVTAETSGEGGTPAPVPAPTANGEPQTPAVNLPAYQETAPFWQMPLEPKQYTSPPVLNAQNLQQMEAEILQLDAYLHGAGYEVERHEIRTLFYGKVVATAQEYEFLRRELEPQRRAIEGQLRDIEEQIRQAEEQFAQKFAEARLPVPHDETPKKKRQKTAQPPPPALITPEYVERALREDFARMDEIAGEQGIAPPRDRGGFLASLYPVGQWLLEFFAPLFAGLILGVNIGVITGLITLTDLTQLANPVMVLIAMLVGMFIEKLAGNGYYHVASTISNASERRGDVPNANSEIPRLKIVFALAFLAPFLLLISIAMVVVDGLGLRMLHEEAIRNAQIGGGEAGEVLPFVVYLIAGAIISLPYLIYKAVMGWRSTEIRQREAYLSYLSWKHIEERRNDATVKEVFGLAGKLVALRNQHAQLSQTLQQIKARLDSARTAAIGVQEEFMHYWHGLIDRLKAERDGYLNGSARNGRAAHAHNEPKTLLSRVLSAFRGR